ncbi:hypothetical protein BRAO285_500001 [Bradyrhizobium sp. ORS 285]|nr:hypothetical protein BRAO285_500001 [Bradyrhizobium sp. ORS 285]
MTIAKRPSSTSRDALKCGGDLPDVAREKSATNWHDGQLAHAGHARIARPVDRSLGQSWRHQDQLGCLVISSRVWKTRGTRLL